MSGIFIVDRWVKQLSGPVSLSFLRPTPTLADALGYKPPLIMLLADQHHSMDQQCLQCMYSVESCCYKTYEPEFLQLLDHLTMPKMTIKIFVEAFSRLVQNKELYENKRDTYELLSSTSHNIVKAHVNEPLPTLYGANLFCFFQVGDQTAYNRFCPTRNIEWHFADARSNMSRIDLHYENVLRPTSTNKGNVYKHDFEFGVSNLVNSLRKKVMALYQNSDKYADLNYGKPTRPYLQFVITVIEACTSTNNTKQLNQLTSTLLSARANGLTYKQAQRLLQAHPSIPVHDLTYRYIQYLVESTSVADQTLNLSFLPILAEALKEGRLTRKTLPANFKLAEQGLGKLIQVFSGFLDLYVMFRMFKVGGSWLNLVSAGFEHCVNMKHFLVDICGWYKVSDEVSSLAMTGRLRCLDLSQLSINLNQEAESYGITPPTKTDPKLYTPYTSNKEASNVGDIDKVRDLVFDEQTMYHLLVGDKHDRVPTEEELEDALSRMKTLAAQKHELNLSTLDGLKEALLYDEWKNDVKAMQVLAPTSSAWSQPSSYLLPYVETLCKTSSARARIKHDVITKLLEKDDGSLGDACIHLHPHGQAVLIAALAKAVLSDNPSLAYKLYDRLTQPDDATMLVSTILMKLKQEASGKKKFDYDVFDTYYPMLSTFRGKWKQNQDVVQELAQVHIKFGEAYRQGQLAATFDHWRMNERD